MDMQAEKLGLIQWLAQLTDEKMIAKIKTLRNESPDWWDTIKAEEKEEIEEGISQANRGEIKPHSVIRKKYEMYYS